VASGRTIEQKVGDWLRAFNAISAELTPPGMREVLRTLKTRDPLEGESPEEYMKDQFAVAQSIGRIVSANDRTAAIAAAMLTQSGIGRPPVDYPEDVQ